jgi:hypothetical protein
MTAVAFFPRDCIIGGSLRCPLVAQDRPSGYTKIGCGGWGRILFAEIREVWGEARFVWWDVQTCWFYPLILSGAHCWLPPPAGLRPLFSTTSSPLHLPPRELQAPLLANSTPPRRTTKLHQGGDPSLSFSPSRNYLDRGGRQRYPNATCRLPRINNLPGPWSSRSPPVYPVVLRLSRTIPGPPYCWISGDRTANASDRLYDPQACFLGPDIASIYSREPKLHPLKDTTFIFSYVSSTCILKRHIRPCFLLVWGLVG